MGGTKKPPSTSFSPAISLKVGINPKNFLNVNFKHVFSGLRQFWVNESPLKVMKNVFCFILKTLFVLNILKFFS